MILKQGKGIFKIRQPKEFNLATRYYDEDKARLNTRIKEIERKHGKEEADKERREINFRSQTNIDWKKNQVAKTRRKSNIRLIIILAALALGFYYLYENVDLVSSTLNNTGR